MPVIIAHSEDCAQVRLGPYQPVPVVEGSTVVKSEWTECDCTTACSWALITARSPAATKRTRSILTVASKSD